MHKATWLDYRQEERIGTLTLLGPVNTLLIGELEALFARLEDERPIDALVIKGQHDHFSRGIDLREFDPKKPLDIHGFHRWEKIMVWLERLPVLTLACVQGAAIGAGFHLMLTCDLRLATDDSTFALDEVQKGFLPGMATYRLAKFVGLGRARALVLGGRVLSAREALEWGLVDHLSTPQELENAVRAQLARVQPIQLTAIEMARRLLNEGYAAQYEDAIGNFLAAQHRCISSDSFLNLVKKAQVDG